MKSKIIRKIEEEREAIKQLGVRKIGLFGSFIKGKQNKKSDIDILVSFKDKDYGEQYFELLFFLQDLLKRKIDLIPEESLRKALIYVKREAEYVRL